MINNNKLWNRLFVDGAFDYTTIKMYLSNAQASNKESIKPCNYCPIISTVRGILCVVFLFFFPQIYEALANVLVETNIENNDPGIDKRFEP